VGFDRRELQQSIPQRFEAIVRAHGERLAVLHGGDTQTYAALNRCANRVARALVARWPHRQASVALMIEQGPALIAGVLGVLKADDIYVPLDPSYPTARLRFMLESSGARMILADAANLPRARALATEACVVLEVERALAAGDVHDLGVATSPDALAYIFYTSGSTGTPKGVADTHRNVLHNVMRYTNGLHICPDDRMSLVQSASFSGAVSSLFGALLNGAASCPYDVARAGVQGLGAWLADAGVTIYHSVPVLFRHLVAAGGTFPSVRVIRLEGDRSTPADLELFKRHFAPPCVLVNGLGATECGLVCRFVVTHDTALLTSTVPIGEPVEDMRVHLLDDDGRDVPPGEIGEIAVTSRYLVPGYWRRPDLTARAFTTDPLDPELRTYRTGDMGRWLSDGCLEHLGRRDFQPKVRGHRVEVEAAEAALVGSGLVREAVVAVREDRPGEPVLVAYVVPSDGAAVSVGELRSVLAATVPAHSIPARFAMLDLLDVPHVTARTTTQATLVAIWQDVIGIRPIGVRDPFLELGGDSIMAVQVIARIAAELGAVLAPRALLATPTIERLAEVVERSMMGDVAGRETFEL